MSDQKAKQPSATVDSSNNEDLGAFLLKRLAVQSEEREVDAVFRALVKLEGSDLHLKVGSPPMVRTKGELRALNRGPINSEEMVKLLVPMMDELISASQAMATRLYQEAAAAQADQGAAGDSASDDDVVEAEIVDEDE